MSAVNSTSEISAYTFTTYELHEILFILFCIIGVFCDVVTIYIILRFKKVRSVENIYITNWACADIASLLITPTAFAIVIGLEHISTVAGFSSACVKLGILLHSATIVAMFLIALDWSLAAHFPRISASFQLHTKSVLVVFWMLLGICGTVSLSVCDTYELCVIDGPALFICFGVVALFVIILNVYRVVQKWRVGPLQYCPLSLNLATVFVFTWTIGLYNVAHLRWSLRYPLISLIMDCATFSSPIVNFVMLYRCNTGFKECVRKVFKRPVQNDENYYQFRNPIVINKSITQQYILRIPEEPLQ